MNDAAVLQLNGTFDYAGDISSKFVTFLKDHIKIEGEKLSTAIKYTEISKITYNSKSVKILTKDGVVKIPCSMSDIKKIKTLFKIRKEFEVRSVSASAVVQLGDLCLIVPVRSNDIKALKIAVLQRIAEHFYPACETSLVSSDMMGQIEIFCKIGDSRRVRLVTNEDLDAALYHLDGRLKLYVGY